MCPYLKLSSADSTLLYGTRAHKEQVFTDLLRPLIPGRTFLDIEGRHHVGSCRDGSFNIRGLGGKEARDDNPVLHLCSIGQDGAMLIQDQLIRILADKILHFLADWIGELCRVDIGAS